DDLDRVITETRPDGGIVNTTYAHDTSHVSYATKQTKTLTLQKPASAGGGTQQIITTIKSNSLGQMVESLDGNGVPVKFAYDPQGNLRWTQVNGYGPTTITVATDVAGNRTQLVDPDAGTLNYQFDALGRMRVQSQALGQTTTVVYDELDRMVSRTDNNGSNETSTWSYYTSGNGKGLLQTITGTDYSKSLSYDS